MITLDLNQKQKSGLGRQVGNWAKETWHILQMYCIWQQNVEM